MDKTLLLFILFIIFINETREHKLTVNKDLRDGKKIPKEEWTYIEVKELCLDDPETLISIDVNVPESVYSKNPSISIFFANETHNALQIKFEKKVIITFYRTPHKVESKTEGPDPCPTVSGRSVHLSYKFTREWLPEKSTKMNAAVEFPDGSVQNLYGIRNYKISLPDLMVLEEYRTLTCPRDSASNLK